MREVLTLPVEDTAPDVGTVLEGQGIPRWKTPDERIIRLANDAIALFKAKAAPVGVLMEIPREEFSRMFAGEGNNHDETPVKPIFENSETLTLFAATIGAPVCDEISSLFRLHEYALASMLDSTASAAAEMAGQLLENVAQEGLAKTMRRNGPTGVLRFSPGYCGWDVSGQKRLFQTLRPEEIGITLNDSHLMHPLKSVSGVIISGPKEIFYFDDKFPFCRDCATHTCRERIKTLMDQ